MMTSGINSGNNWLSQLGQLGNANQSCGTNGADSTGNTSAANGGDTMTSPGGKLLDAITAALSQIGVGSGSTSSTSASSTGTDSSSTSTQDPAQALASFMQELMAALHSQGGSQSAGSQGGTDSDGDNDGSGTSGVSGSGRHRPNIQADLQSLIQQLSSSSADSSSASSSTADTSSADTTLSSLEQSFQSLISSLGGSGSTTSLTDFLQAFANNMQGESSVGNVVKAQA